MASPKSQYTSSLIASPFSTTEPTLIHPRNTQIAENLTLPPWIHMLLASPTHKPMYFYQPDWQPTMSTNIWTTTLATARTIPALITLMPANESASSESNPHFLIATLNPGVDGRPGMLHGGVTTTLLDEAMVIAGGRNMATVKLSVEFKRAVQTPITVVCRAWVEAWEGRRAICKARMEGQGGMIFAVAEGIVVKPRGAKA